ncbi:MAG: glycerophosphodiester phosphodiesterase [Myxococcota bacterium]
MTHPYFSIPRPTILGHRGAGGVAPENTLASFERGLADGADILESDVHATRDGVPVLIHDPSLDRTTDGTGPVSGVTLEELRRFDAAHGFSREGEPCLRGRGITVPTLEEAFDAFPDARFNLEIKARDAGVVDRVVELVRERGREDTTLLVAEKNDIMDALRRALARHAKRPAVGASLADVLAVIRSAQSGEAPDTDSLALQIPAEFGGEPLVTPELIAHAHAHGIVIHVWTINEEQEMTELLDRGVDGLVTDFPGRLRALLERRGER